MVRGAGLSLLLIGILAAAPAAAQDNLHRGKSPQQIFNTDCGICHNSVRGLGAAMGAWQLSRFLADHYTTSKATASTLASYLLSIRRDEPERPQRPRRPTNRQKQKSN